MPANCTQLALGHLLCHLPHLYSGAGLVAMNFTNGPRPQLTGVLVGPLAYG